MLIKPKDNAYYTEASQSYKAQFAWCTLEGNDIVLQHHFVLCRDFLGDYVNWLNQKAFDKRIYGFNVPEGAKKTNLLAISFPQDANARHLANNLKAFDFKNVFTVVASDPESRTVVVEFNPESMRTIWQISLYSFLIKVLSYVPYKEGQTLEQILNQVSSGEQMYVLAVAPERIIALLNKAPTMKYAPGMTLPNADMSKIYDMPAWEHNDNGFVSVFRRNAAASFYKDQLNAM